MTRALHFETPVKRDVEEFFQYAFADAQRRLEVCPGPIRTVVDVGAYVGVFTLAAARAGAVRIFAFEPAPDSFALLVHNVKRNNCCHCILPIQLAVTGGVSTPLALRRLKNGNPGQTGIGFVDEYTEIGTVQTWPLSAVLALAGTVDYLKMDVEGMEFDILAPCGQTAEALQMVRWLDVEVHADPARTRFSQGTLDAYGVQTEAEVPGRLLTFLEECGFVGIGENFGKPGVESLVAGNRRFAQSTSGYKWGDLATMRRSDEDREENIG